ncbi:putative nucleoporin GLE1 [Apostichopus japonicus]|uniref:mRNA export factor GLE1 n=1 Tax=Stichopus japonicus TaxID=307972 RepID=A0A2G8LIG6_STIJA|nr:putative nucleoporin GLE1 [Apostichopus japonicus]
MWLLGYQYDSEGVIEKQDKYLKRMSGFTRLYAAILVSSPPPGCGQISPFGRERAWQWLSRLLNLEPQPDITATMLFDFLEVCGFALIETYNKQFFKLLEVLIHGYFPKIEAVTPKGSGGPVMRLKSYLQQTREQFIRFLQLVSTRLGLLVGFHTTDQQGGKRNFLQEFNRCSFPTSSWTL